jgi:AcrR family transcriptional regulator
MSEKKKRGYDSPKRQQQAEETRRKITDAAHELLLASGYDKMTIESVAKAAGVAAPTVYAVFGSKRGILAAIIDRARFGEGYTEAVARAKTAEDPIEELRLVPKIARRVYDAERDLIGVLRGAGVVAPELSEVLQEREGSRYQGQVFHINRLVEAGRLRSGLPPEEARDILWTFTGRDLYRLLVQERGWSSDRYEEWLADTLTRLLTE